MFLVVRISSYWLSRKSHFTLPLTEGGPTLVNCLSVWRFKTKENHVIICGAADWFWTDRPQSKRLLLFCLETYYAESLTPSNVHSKWFPNLNETVKIKLKIHLTFHPQLTSKSVHFSGVYLQRNSVYAFRSLLTETKTSRFCHFMFAWMHLRPLLFTPACRKHDLS